MNLAPVSGSSTNGAAAQRGSGGGAAAPVLALVLASTIDGGGRSSGRQGHGRRRQRHDAMPSDALLRNGDAGGALAQQPLHLRDEGRRQAAIAPGISTPSFAGRNWRLAVSRTCRLDRAARTSRTARFRPPRQRRRRPARAPSSARCRAPACPRASTGAFGRRANCCQLAADWSSARRAAPCVCTRASSAAPLARQPATMSMCVSSSRKSAPGTESCRKSYQPSTLAAAAPASPVASTAHTCSACAEDVPWCEARHTACPARSHSVNSSAFAAPASAAAGSGSPGGGCSGGPGGGSRGGGEERLQSGGPEQRELQAAAAAVPQHDLARATGVDRDGVLRLTEPEHRARSGALDVHAEPHQVRRRHHPCSREALHSTRRRTRRLRRRLAARAPVVHLDAHRLTRELRAQPRRRRRRRRARRALAQHAQRHRLARALVAHQHELGAAVQSTEPPPRGSSGRAGRATSRHHLRYRSSRRRRSCGRTPRAAAAACRRCRRRQRVAVAVEVDPAQHPLERDDGAVHGDQLVVVGVQLLEARQPAHGGGHRRDAVGAGAQLAGGGTAAEEGCRAGVAHIVVVQVDCVCACNASLVLSTPAVAVAPSSSPTPLLLGHSSTRPGSLSRSCRQGQPSQPRTWRTTQEGRARRAPAKGACLGHATAGSEADEAVATGHAATKLAQVA